MQKALAAGEKEQTETDEVKEPVAPKIKITAEDLSRYGKFRSICVCRHHCGETPLLMRFLQNRVSWSSSSLTQNWLILAVSSRSSWTT